MLIHDLHLSVNRDGVTSRRSFLRAAAAGTAAGLTWRDAVTAAAGDLRKHGVACILLFMEGAPSQFETFDPKPGTRTGGPTRAIDTAVPGVRVAEHFPQVAKQMADVSLVRSLHSRDANHPSAQYLLRTGYKLSGGVKYPHFGSVAAQELGDAAFDLPHFVCVGGNTAAGSGYLPKSVAPYAVGDPERMPLNAELPRGVTPEVLKRRLGLMGKLEEDFADAGGKALVADNRALTETAARMVLSPRLKAFDVSQEPDAVRDRYGRTPFGQGCLLARRLVEAGVTFVEVVSSNWDTHRDNFEGVKKLAGAVDPAFAALVADLKERGRLDKTLVVWTGEFGRTPTINGNAGRDHYSRAWSAAVAGGGTKGGRVVGSTDANGVEVASRPVSVPDLFRTFCKSLGIDADKKHDADGRPVELVEGGEAVKELF